MTAHPCTGGRRRHLGPWCRLIALLLGAFAAPVSQAAPPPRATPWLGSKVTGSPEPPPLGQVERVFPQLGFTSLTDFAYEPTTRRWFVAQQDGRFTSFPDQPDASAVDPVADLAAVAPGLSQFLAFTFHPGFATNRLVFLHYSVVEGSNTVARLVRAPLTATTPPRLDTNLVTELLRWPAGGHDGGCLKFGPDGMLYVAIGDAASPEPPDPLRTGQDVSDLLASILRLDVDHPEPGRAYRTPADNPFVKLAGARPEVWAYGFRNPWRMGFGPDGALWVGDVGWELWETVHKVSAGYNAGWSLVEGPNPAVRTDVKVGPTPVRAPFAAHPHSEAASLTGGVVARDDALGEWRGQFLYGDWETGKIWALRDAPGAKPVELVDTPLRIVGFAEGPNREVLFAHYGEAGGLYRLLPNAATTAANTFPRRLSATGLFADTAKQQPAPGVEAYGIAAEMWSDGATSERWVAVPGDGVIQAVWNDDPNQRKWSFPKDSVLVKTYSLDLAAGDGRPERRRIETQLLHFNGDAWAAYSYRWNATQTDAELIPAAGTNVTMTAASPALPGGRGELSWRFAARAECLRCHNPWSGNALAVSFDQLLTPPVRGSSPTAASELQRLALSGLLALPESFDTNHLVSAGDSAAPLDARARSWLHVNCAHCHRSGAGGSVASYFNFDGKLEELRLLGQKPLRGTFGLNDPAVITAGRPERSVLWFRLNTEGQGHMPHIGSRLVDDAGSRLLAEWIESLGPNAQVPEPAPGSTSAALTALRRAQRDPATLAAFVATHRAATNAFARDLATHFLPTAERRHVLGAEFDPQLVLALTGDAARGRQLFHSDSGPQCARCHILDGAGRNYGPDLSLIGQRYDRGALLEHILQPSKLVAPEFVLHLVETKDSRSLAGFVVAAAGDVLQLRLEDGGVVRLPHDQIGSDTRSELSAMPEGLLATLTAAEAADLLAYLATPRR